MDKMSIHALRESQGRSDRCRPHMAVGTKRLIVAHGAIGLVSRSAPTMAVKEVPRVRIDLFGPLRIEIESVVAQFTASLIEIVSMARVTLGMTGRQLSGGQLRRMVCAQVALGTVGCSLAVQLMRKKKATRTESRPIPGPRIGRVAVASAAVVGVLHIVAVGAALFTRDRSNQLLSISLDRCMAVATCQPLLTVQMM